MRKVLIVEDEMIIAENMRIIISTFDNYEMPLVACNLDEANDALNTAIDLVLLDIRLGVESGIEFTDVLNKKQIPFVFVTSHGDLKTVQEAINKNPLGYIIKPINQQTLQSQLELAFSKITKKKYYIFKSGRHDVRIPEDEIVFLKSDNVYTELHTKNERYIIRNSTKNILDELNINLIQVHRSYFVNPNFIIETNAKLKLTTGHELPLSRTYKPNVLENIYKKQS